MSKHSTTAVTHKTVNDWSADLYMEIYRIIKEHGPIGRDEIIKRVKQGSLIIPSRWNVSNVVKVMLRKLETLCQVEETNCGTWRIVQPE